MALGNQDTHGIIFPFINSIGEVHEEWDLDPREIIPDLTNDPPPGGLSFKCIYQVCQQPVRGCVGGRIVLDQG